MARLLCRVLSGTILFSVFCLNVTGQESAPITEDREAIAEAGPAPSEVVEEPIDPEILWLREFDPGEHLGLGGSVLQPGYPAEKEHPIIDGDPVTVATLTSAEGPPLWLIRLQEGADCEAAAFLWPPHGHPQFRLEGSIDGQKWETLANVSASQARATCLSFENQPSRFLRVVAPGEKLMLHEVAAYREVSDIPIRWVSEAGFKPASPFEVEDENKDLGVTLRDGWIVRRSVELPEGFTPRQLVPSQEGASGLLLGYDERAGRDRLLAFQGEGDANKITVLTDFIEELPERSVVGWDGEWLHVFSGGEVTQYRDTNRDFKADEKLPSKQLYELAVATDGGSPAANQSDFRVSHLHLDALGWYSFRFYSSGTAGAFLPSHEWIDLPSSGRFLWHPESGTTSLVADGASRIVAHAGNDRGSYREIHEESVDGSKRFQFVTDISFGSSGLDAGSMSSDHGDFRYLGNGPQEGSVALTDTTLFLSDSSSGRFQSWAKAHQFRQAEIDRFGNCWITAVGPAEQEWLIQVEAGNFEVVDPVLPNRLDDLSPLQLVEGLKSSHSEWRRLVALEWQRRKKPPPLPLKNLLEDEEAPIAARQLALGILMGRTKGQVPDWSMPFAESEAPELRGEFFRQISTISSARNHPVYQRINQETEPMVTAAILESMVLTKTDRKGVDSLAMEWSGHPDPILATAAARFLRQREATQLCFATLVDESATLDARQGAATVLASLYRQSVVEELVSIVEQTDDPVSRRISLETLAKLYRLPGERRDDEGLWEASGLIASLLQASLGDRRVDSASLLRVMTANEIPLGSHQRLLDLAREQVSLVPFVFNVLEKAEALPIGVEDWLTDIVESDAHDPSLRSRAFALRLTFGVESLDRFAYRRLFDQVARYQAHGFSSITDQDLRKNWSGVRHPLSQAGYLIGIAKSGDLARKTLAKVTLRSMLAQAKSDPQTAETEKSRRAIESYFKSLASSESAIEQSASGSTEEGQ